MCCFKWIIWINNSQEKIAIIPDIAGYWISSSQKNPLTADWLNSTEVPKNELEKLKKVIYEFYQSGGSILVTKFRTDTLGGDQFVSNFDDYEIITFIKENLKKTFETNFFQIYSK